MAYDIKSWYQNILKTTKITLEALLKGNEIVLWEPYAHKLGLHISSAFYNRIVYASFRGSYYFAQARDKKLVLIMTYHKCSKTKWPALLSNVACCFCTFNWIYWCLIVSSISGICSWAIHNDVINFVFQFHKALQDVIQKNSNCSLKISWR